MKYPKEVRTYCPHCRAHTAHKVKLVGKGARRSMAMGDRKHNRSLEGHGGKRAGEKSVKKQGKHQVVVMECGQCKKKHNRTIGSRTRKKLEMQ